MKFLHYEFIKRLRGYILTRFVNVGALWTLIAGGVWLANKLYNFATSTTHNEVLSTVQNHPFADLWLVLAISIGAMIVPALRSILAINLTFSDNRNDWGQKFATKILDEISAAVTHFMWISCFYFVAFDRTQIIAHVAILLYLIVLAVGTFDAEGNVENFNMPTKNEYDTLITTPLDSDKVDQVVPAISGTMSKSPPKDFELWLIRRFKKDAQEFHPMKKIELPPVEGLQRKAIEWHASNCFIGGQLNAKDERFLEVWLIGKQGAAVFRAWSDGNKRFSGLKDSGTVGSNMLYPGLVEKTSDMVALTTSHKLLIN